MNNRNVVCGIIPDVMTLSAELRHFNTTMTLLFKYRLYQLHRPLPRSTYAICVSDFKLCNLIITYLSSLFLKKININFFLQDHIYIHSAVKGLMKQLHSG